MKENAIILILLLTFVHSCDGPNRTRVIEEEETATGTSASGLGNGNTMGAGEFRYINDPPQGDLSGSTNTTANPDNNDYGCEPGLSHYTQYLDYFGVCRDSASGEDTFRVKFSKSDVNDGYCIVTMHIFSDNTSTVTSNRAECVHAMAGQVYKATFSPEHRLYPVGQYPTNGVIVIKASMINHFYSCMLMKSLILQQNPGCEYNPACLMEASNQAYAVCQNFFAIANGLYKIINI